MTFKIAIALVFLVSAVTGRKIKCTNPKVMEGFDIALYTGVWYEIERQNPIPFEIDLSCSFQNNRLIKDYLSFSLEGTQKDGEHKAFTGTIKTPFVHEEAKNLMKFDNSMYRLENRILDTDYLQYAVTYACNTKGMEANIEHLWIWSRYKTLAPEIIANIYQLFDNLGVNRTKLETVDQSCK